MKKNYTIPIALFCFLFNAVLSFAQCSTAVTNISGSTSICAGNTTTLTATHDGDNVYWFDAATNGTLLFTGNPYQTTALNGTTSFWAESRKQTLGAAIPGGAKPAPTSTSTSSVVSATSPWGLVFNVTQSFKLNSVDVFLASTTAGSLVINLRNSSNATLQSWTVPTPAGGTASSPVQFTVPLNYTLPVGNGYRLVAVSSPTMIRDLTTAPFPYAIGTVGSVTQGTINNSLTSNPGVYYFFYNWNYSPVLNCVSARQQATVTVTTTSPPTGDAQQLFTPGETIADLDVTGTGLQWYSDAAGTMSIPTSTVLTEGTTYYVSQTLNGCPGTLLAVTAVTVLGLDSAVFNKLRYFPNPVTGTFSLQHIQSGSQIEIYSVLGQQMASKIYDSDRVILDFSTFESGLYLVKITSGNETKTIRVIKK